MKTIEVGGEEYTVRGNPDMRTVKHVQSMEIEMMREFISDDELLKMEEADSDDVMDDVLEDADVEDLMEMLWKRSTQKPLQTICLGTNSQLTSDDLMGMRAKEFGELRDASEEALGGTAPDFIRGLNIDIGSTEKIAEAVQEEQNSSSDNLPPAVSEISREQSEEQEATQPTKNT